MKRFDPQTQRRLAQGSMLGAGVVLAVALFGIVNYFGWKYHLRGDWTSSRLYTLSQKSEQVLRSLSEPIRVTVFMGSDEPLFEPTQELLARYEAASPRVTVRTVDPARNPAEAQSLVDRLQLSRGNVVVFEQGEDRRVVEAVDLAEYDYSGYQFGQPPQLTSFKGEQAFTSAVLALTEGDRPRILFTTGHGEASLDDQGPSGLSSVAELLGRDNFELEEWASLGEQRVPAGADLVVIAAPTARFTPPELEAFGAFLEGGGRLLVLLDPLLTGAGSEATGLEGWLAGYGIEVRDDVVVDPDNPVPFYGAESFFVDSYAEHPITRSLSQAGYPVILSLARSIEVAAGTPAGAESSVLLETGDGAWGETDLAALGEVQRNDDDLAGPRPLAIALWRGDGTEEGGDAGSPQPAMAETATEEGADGAEVSGPGFRLVVFGDSEFARNGQIGSVGNPTLVANTMNWLVERTRLLGIPPREPEQTRLNLTGAELRRLFWLVVAGLPGLAVAAGVVVTLRRRR